MDILLAVMIDVAVHNDSNIKEKEHEKLTLTLIPMVIGAPELEEWFQQISGSTTEISVQKSAVLGTAEILRRTLRFPGLW